MENAVSDFIKKKNLALIGLSKTKGKFGNYAYKELTSRGYNVYAVHPSGEEIDGIPCSKDLASIKDKVEGVFVSVSKKNIPLILQDISSVGLKNVWLQQGCESNEAIEEAEKLGLNLISKKCILMYAEPVKSFHKFHRFLSDVFTRN
ncbi:MAG: CoA-binding protein [Ignavibacteria bacterium]|nr:CoA-binding protein [Ignavibacteria bacterium]